MKMQDTLPVVFSIVIIIAVAFLQKQSKLAAALTATISRSSPMTEMMRIAPASAEASRASNQCLANGPRNMMRTSGAKSSDILHIDRVTLS